MRGQLSVRSLAHLFLLWIYYVGMFFCPFAESTHIMKNYPFNVCMSKEEKEAFYIQV